MNKESADYKRLYFTLLTAVEYALDAIDEREYKEARYILAESARKVEDIYLWTERSPEKWDVLMEIAKGRKSRQTQ